MIRIVIVIASLLVSLDVFAIGEVVNAKVVQVRVDVDGRAMIYFDQTVSGEPATCVHTSYINAFGVDASTEGGKAVLSMALTAKTTGSLVTAYGLGVCGVYGGQVVETWNHGFLK